jgi:hypothetical protein
MPIPHRLQVAVFEPDFRDQAKLGMKLPPIRLNNVPIPILLRYRLPKKYSV